MTKEQHDKLIYLHNLIAVNRIINMKANELDEYSKLMAMSLEGKGNDVPVSQLTQGIPAVAGSVLG